MLPHASPPVETLRQYYSCVESNVCVDYMMDEDWVGDEVCDSDLNPENTWCLAVQEIGQTVLGVDN